jgi:hypothetical protein
MTKAGNSDGKVGDQLEGAVMGDFGNHTVELQFYIIFSCHYNNVSYGNVELGEILGGGKVQSSQNCDVEYTKQ